MISNKKVILYWLFSVIVYGKFSVAYAMPEVCEWMIEGTVDQPVLVAPVLEFMLHKEYVLTIKNPHPISWGYHVGDFGHHVMTRYLGGVPSVTQESMSILPNGTLTWHFVTAQSGKFSFFIANPGSGVKSETHEVVIRDPAASADLENKSLKKEIAHATSQRFRAF